MQRRYFTPILIFDLGKMSKMSNSSQSFKSGHLVTSPISILSIFLCLSSMKFVKCTYKKKRLQL